MSDIVDRLRTNSGLIYDNYGAMGSPIALEAANEIERLTAERERMWCKACGTVTRDGTCDCTKFPEYADRQQLVNYADAMAEDARELAVECDRLRAFEKSIAERNVELADENKRLRQTMELFANPLNWNSDGYHVEWLLENEPWEEARRALAEPPRQRP